MYEVLKHMPFIYAIQHLLFSLSICRRYDEITDRITSKLSTTEELVELNQYLRHTSEVTVHKLHHEIEEAVKRLDFLLDYATLPGTNILCVMCACKYCVFGNTALLKYTTNTNISTNHVIFTHSLSVQICIWGCLGFVGTLFL